MVMTTNIKPGQLVCVNDEHLGTVAYVGDDGIGVHLFGEDGRCDEWHPSQVVAVESELEATWN